LLHVVVVCYKLFSSQVLLQGSKQMYINWACDWLERYGWAVTNQRPCCSYLALSGLPSLWTTLLLVDKAVCPSPYLYCITPVTETSSLNNLRILSVYVLCFPFHHSGQRSDDVIPCCVVSAVDTAELNGITK